MHFKINKTFLLFPFLTLLLLLSSCKEKTKKADLIITNAVIWTGNPNQKEVQAMAISGDAVLALGTNQEMNELRGKKTKMVDARGNFITPGFIDSHVHLLQGGNSLLSVMLRDAKTPAEFTKRIADFTEKLAPGEWILEGNWDHTLWGGALPVKEWIDKYTLDNPVVVYRLDGHMLLANSAALKYAGIDKNTRDVPEGEIVRDKNGNPTGILKGNAMLLMQDKIPELTQLQKTNALKAAMVYFAANGVTSVHDLDSLSSYKTAKKQEKKHDLTLRIYGARPLNKWIEIADTDLQNDKWLKRGLLKGFVDGTLGSHTAAFNADYTDKANDKGFLITDQKKLSEWIFSADKANLNITVHAIGDHAIHTILTIYEDLITKNGKKDRRLRVEHAQHIAPEDMRKFAELGIIASVQPYHAIDDGRWAEKLIGPERIKTTYAFKSLLDAKTKVVFGSDWPVAPTSPLLGIYAAVTRRTLDGKNPNGWIPEQKITVEQALNAYTKDAAYASFDEKVKGTLEPGKLADFVIINGDLTKIDPVKIKDLSVLMTYVGGKKVYDSSKKKPRTVTIKVKR
ncbi:amidohydrolase [Flavobacterium sp. PL002]|uniref:amidohydrolase n=1 Tax=Flavobacterium sp. PL002 TaxID=1897058 RepID=UPI001787CFD3|nr:amidohydrolase [Flavobacterium sp. PL002]MBE0393393.1 N-substituted formamide deformylase [Flavobacterium sp. PL002]